MRVSEYAAGAVNESTARARRAMVERMVFSFWADITRYENSRSKFED
jgi:hypothetical protein